MSRPKAFEEDAVLAAAMNVFRSEGFAGASLKALQDATGLASGSLYHSYRDKAGLFQAALAHYNQRVVQGRIARHLKPGSGLEGLRKLFRSLLREPGGTRDGCLLTNTAVELGGEPAVLEGFGLLQQAFARSLHEALPRADAQALALRLLVLYQGLLVMVRAGRPDAELAPLIDAEFDTLQGGHR